MSLASLDFIELNREIDLSSFDCSHSDINEFLIEDSLGYQEQSLAKTYLFINAEKKPVAFFSISNDCLADLGDEDGITNRIWNRFHRHVDIPNQKRIRQYPAIKVGRLGVHRDYQRRGLAYELMDFIKGWVIIDSKPACRLLLLDAYNLPKQLSYYQKNGFRFIMDEDESDKTRIMYYDLSWLKD